MNTEPSIESLLANLNMGGDGGAEARIASELDERSRLAREKAQLIDACFSTPAGRQVLEMMLDLTLRRAEMVYAPGMNLEQAAAHGLFRAGENNIVRWILAGLRAARDGGGE
jgi:hypothetical protein